MAAIVKPFWKSKKLEQMTQEEWESLCDSCGLCCLQKLADAEDPNAVYYTRIACKLLDLGSARCSNYPNRQAFVPDCIQLKAADIRSYNWLPQTCAYRLLAEDKPLPPWHHLICGDVNAVHASGVSQYGRMLGEKEVPEEEWENHLIFRC